MHFATHPHPATTAQANELADGQIIADGIYYIQSVYSSYYMQVTDGSFANNTYVSHMNKNIDSDGDGELYLGTEYDVRYMWNIQYVGNGKYTIYSMNHLQMQLNLATFDWSYEPVAVASYNTSTPTPDGTPGDILWSIMRDENGYVIMQDGDISKTLFAQNINRSVQPTIVAAEYEEEITNCHWNFILPDAQIMFYSSHSYISNYYHSQVAVGDTKDISELDFLIYTCPALPKDCTITWASDNPSVATVDMYTGQITGISKGTAYITMRVLMKHHLVERSFSIHVVAVEDGLYYIRNKETGQYLDALTDQPKENSQPILYGDRRGAPQHWTIKHLEDGTYTIMHATSELYLGTNIDGSLLQGVPISLREPSENEELSQSTGILWNIHITDSGYKLISQNSNSDSLVLTPSDQIDNYFPNVEQNAYTADQDYIDEWALIRFYPLTLQVYYDSYSKEAYRDENGSGYYNIKKQMNALADFYWSRFSIYISWTGINQISTYIDACPSFKATGECYCGSCTNSWDPYYPQAAHHCNIRNILMRAPIPKEPVDAVILFIGHETCTKVNNAHRLGYYYGLAYKNYGLIAINHIGRSNDPYDNEECTQTLIHEVGHLFEIEDHYGTHGSISTDTANTDYGANIFSENCMYGEHRFDTNNRTRLCQGCEWILRKNRNKYEN